MSHLDEGRLTLLLDGELTPAERAEAERHLAACAECRRLYEEVKGLAGEADRLVAAVEPAARPAPVLPGPTRRPPLAWERWRPLAWAATLVLAASLGWYSRLGHVDGAPTGDQRSGASLESAKAADVTDSAREAMPPAAPPAALPEAATHDRPAASPSATRPAEAPATAAAPAMRQLQPAPASAPAPPAALAAPRRDAEQSAGSLATGNALEARRERTPAAAGASRAMTTAEAPLAPRDEVTSKQRLDAIEDAAVSPVQAVSMEQAVRLLGGSIRLVDGMTPVAVRTVPGQGVPGAEPDAVVVRIVYLDPPGRELWLDQQRPRPAEPEAGARTRPTLLPGDTLLSALADGQRRLRWRDPEGFHLSLAGWLSGDSLKALARRVR